MFIHFPSILDGMSRNSSILVTRSLSSKAADSVKTASRNHRVGTISEVLFNIKGEGIIIYKMNSKIYLCIVSMHSILI